ncbi:MAG: hypothetical protein FJY75_10725, partial [Candidatus Eisenbacteria bacterium]|nr:hypothetical protein [Candidatus Eisenbacteria bacterium]
ENVYGVAVSIAADGRAMNYVLDSGNRRILGYETNIDIARLSNGTAGVAWTDPRTAAKHWDDQGINLAEWQASADRWVIPGSDVFKVNGESWTRVADVSIYGSSDKVYTIQYADAANAPELLVPTGALRQTDLWELVYCLSDYRGGGTAAFGLGDVDQGNSAGATVSPVLIDQSAPVAKSFQDLRDVFTITNQSTATTDELWLIDAADNSAGQNEALMVYTVTQGGGVEAFLEAYDDLLYQPSAVHVARTATDAYTQPTYTAVASIPHFTTAAVVDANQVTGHTYSITMSGAAVTITDLTTGRKLVDGAAKTHFVTGSNTCYVIPGLGVDFDTAVADDATALFATRRAVPSRYAFVCDRGNDRIKVIGVGDFGATTGDDLPGDAHTCGAQPSGAGTVGAVQDEDYYFTTPASVPPNWKTGTLARPIKQGSLETITADPDGAPVVWTRIDDLATAGPADNVYQLDWYEGVILFGDGLRGALPPAATEFSMTYATTPDVLRYGTTGSGAGQFSSPRDVCAIWNAGLGCFVVYVADTGNNRIQKFLFHPESASLGIPPRMEYVCSWRSATTPDDLLNGPRRVDVATNGTSYYIAVADASNRVLVYKDTAFFSTGTTPPDYEAAIGGSGSILGSFASIDGLDLVRDGSEMEIYVADGERDVVTKYVLAPTASIALAFTGASALPNSFPPTGGYPLTYTVANAPAGAYVDFYFGSQATWSEATSRLCFPAGSKGTDLGTIRWAFSSSPNGTPADGSYYLQARLLDASGNLLASDAAGAGQLLRIDSGLTTSLRVRDKADGDPTLLIAPNQDKTFTLELTYPDSVVGAAFVGTFPADYLEIVSIAPGPGWEGTGYLQHVWNATYDNTAGTYSVMTSVLGAPLGLTGSGASEMAYVTVRPRANALNATQRVRSGQVALTAGSSTITDKNGAQPEGWVTRGLDAYVAYVGDIAHATTGADSVAPYLQPRPDGYMTFADQMAFTRGWNGVNNVRDPIADIGPVTGSAPYLTPAPDGKYDIGDVLAFTTNWSWFTGNGYSMPTATDGLALNAFSPLGPAVEGGAQVEFTASLAAPLPGQTMTVAVEVNGARALTGAMVRVAYDPQEFILTGVERGELLAGNGAAVLLNTMEREGLCEICVTRLHPDQPGVTGDGTLALLTFRAAGPSAEGLACAYDLRDWEDRVLARGTSEIVSLGEGAATSVVLCQNYPNPLNPGTSIVFSLPE